MKPILLFSKASLMPGIPGDDDQSDTSSLREKSAGTVKQPWELTAEEIETVPVEYGEGDEWLAFQRSLMEGKTRAEAHAEAVEQALEAGKPVPDAVMSPVETEEVLAPSADAVTAGGQVRMIVETKRVIFFKAMTK
jgi:hypothetical protein